MISNRTVRFITIGFLAVVPAQVTFADTVTGAGGLVGPFLGGVFVIELGKKKPVAETPPPTTTTTTKATTPRRVVPSISAEQRAENRALQVALNYFAFPVGAPDGSIGPKTRGAISNYQEFLGHEASGKLNDDEMAFLLAAYARAREGDEALAPEVAENPEAVQAQLIAWSKAVEAPEETVVAAADAPLGALSVLPTAAPEAEVVAVAEPQAAPVASLPLLLTDRPRSISLIAHCDRVAQATETNGGFATVDAMLDPNQALNEQFCLARSFAISTGDDVARRLSGFTPEEVAAQCAGFGPAMQAQIEALSSNESEVVLASVQKFVASTGLPSDQLIGTAKICLSVGYRTDDMQVALASGLILASMGEGVYGELMGHHLAQGIGAAKRPDLALSWFEMSLDALNGGAPAVFAPGLVGRGAIVQRAAYLIAGRPDPLGAEDETVMAAAPVPGFTIIAVDPVTELASVPAAEGGATLGSKLGALPIAARLPFLLFRN